MTTLNQSRIFCQAGSPMHWNDLDELLFEIYRARCQAIGPDIARGRDCLGPYPAIKLEVN